MPRRYSTREIENALLSIGFTLVRQQGSHARYTGKIAGITRHVTLVAGQRQVQASTVSRIMTQLGLSRDDFDFLVDKKQLPDHLR